MEKEILEGYKEEILFYLDNPGKISRVSFFDDTYKKNVDLIFSTIFDEKAPADSAEACAYLFGKACEMNILKVVRPDNRRIWLSKKEVLEGIVFDLPHHLEDAVLEAMDGCEDACSEYIKNNVEVDVKDLLLDIEYIAEAIVVKHRLFNIEVEGFNNSMVAFPQELYIYANNIGLKALEQRGYKILGTAETFTSPVSAILESPLGEKMAVYEHVTISPNTAKFANYKIEELKKYAEKEKLVPYCLGIMVEAEDEASKKAGVIVKGQKAAIKMTSFIDLK